MFNNTQKFLFMTTLMMGTMITISSSSWLSAWMGLEINLLSFIPLINNSNNLLSSETALKYFLTQAIASSVFFISVIVSMMKSEIIPMNNEYVYQALIAVSLMIKTGVAPFHFWFPSIMEGLNWINAIILLTWQKIAPMVLMLYVFNMSMMIWMIIASALIGALGGLNQTSLRKIMAFSSINHLAWMLSSMQESVKLTFTYFLFYSVMSITVMMVFFYTKSFHLNQLFSVINESKILKFVVFINLLSLGGLPPFTGFFPKWIVIQNIASLGQMFIMFVLILSSLITLFFYLRLAYSAFMLGNYTHNWNTISMNNANLTYKLLIMTWVSLMGLSFISLFYI